MPSPKDNSSPFPSKTWFPALSFKETWVAMVVCMQEHGTTANLTHSSLSLTTHTLQAPPLSLEAAPITLLLEKSLPLLTLKLLLTTLQS